MTSLMATILKLWRQIEKNPLCQSTSIYLKNILPNFDPVWNDGALGFLEDGRSNKNENMNNKMSSDMRSVPDHNNRTPNLWLAAYIVTSNSARWFSGYLLPKLLFYM